MTFNDKVMCINDNCFNIRVSRKYVILLTLILGNIVEQPSLNVEIAQGIVQGRVSGNGEYYEYLGIPYGTANFTNRFQAPFPPPKWRGIFKAVNEHHRCPQLLTKKVVFGEEDCLKINVYTPKPIRSSAPLPVMVFIHGGAFVEGSASRLVYGPDFIIRHGVVLVTFNYRLGALGFLCLGTEEAPGNAGLKDQVAALRWVNKNIRAFGGDPDNVTIFGESAGGASVSYMRLSPLAKGLFKRAIIHSGSSLPIWALSGDPIGVASRFAEEFGFYSKDPKTLLKIYKNVTIDTLINTPLPKKEDSIMVSNIWFIPCIENVLTDIESLINRPPYEILKSGHYNDVPTISGYNDREGLFLISKEDENSLKDKENTYNLPTDLGLESIKEKKNVSRQMRKLYFDDKPISKETLLNLADYYGDLHFKFPVIFETKFVLETTKEPQYNYLFRYSGYRNVVKNMVGFKDEQGATHADDLFYMFKSNLVFSYSISDSDQKVIDRFTTMWTNFAKYGNPTPSATDLLPVVWKTSEIDNLKLLTIDKEITMESLNISDKLTFWNETYSKYRRKFHPVGNKTLPVFFWV